MIRTLENDQLRVQINDLGAELTEIYDKTNDRQVLWNLSLIHICLHFAFHDS